MTTRSDSPSPLEYLASGGEMGARMRTFDWAATPVGPVENWPQSMLSALSMMLPSKAQIILFWGPHFVVFYNDAYRPVFGAKHPHALGRPGSEAWQEIWDSQLRELLEGVVKTGEAFWARDLLFLIERHGFLEETYFDVSYDPVRDESGNVGGVFCIVTETTGRVVGERRLSLLRDMAAHNAAARTSRDACALAAQTLAGAPADVRGALLYLDGQLAACTPGAEEALQASAPAQVRERTLSPPGSASSGRLVIALNPRRACDAQYESFVDLVANQITAAIANAQAYEEERKRVESLAELDRAKTAFFSNVSHEFRTPLTLILGPLEELAERSSDTERRMLRLAQRNAKRMLKLVNTLLDFACIEAGRAQARYELTDLAALTADLGSNFRSACERADLKLDVRCQRRTVEGWVDREMWEKIVLNLLSNAVKFTIEGSITVDLQEQDGHLVLTVADTGVGIPRAALGRVFERFHRFEGPRGRSHEGSGIGLALVQELVKLHGGTIAVDSDLNKGATFTIAIPRGNDHLPREHLGKASKESAPRRSVSPYVDEALGWLPGSEMPQPEPLPLAFVSRVLVADDNADLREYACRLLAEQYEVELVRDGVEALAAARMRRPDVIVSDVMMPRLDGFGLIAALRADPALRTVPVLLLSARAGEEARLEGLHRGADDYLVKPFSARELLARVAALRQADEIRFRALQALRQSSAQLQVLFDHAPLGMYLVDADFRVREVNPVALPVFGGVPGGVIGRDFDEIIHILWEGDYADEIVRIFHRTLETGESHVEPESSRRRRDLAGVIESYEWRIDRIPLPDGRNGVVCYFRDISAQVLARQALEDSHAALRDADRRKNEFLATLAHELRNPLAPLRNALTILHRRTDGDASLAALREIMERQFNNLVRLVDDLLEMSRITTGTLELKRERVELSEVVRNAVETSEPVVRGGQHRLELSLPGEALWLEGDPLRLVQILSNLLNNAAKYTPARGVIALSARRDKECVAVSVCDNGIGIPADALGRIFEMFRREGRSDLQAQGGLGIGLTLARRLAELHGGTIEARSDGAGKGAEFVVRLPLAAAIDARAAGRRPAPAVPLALRVLVVDDNVDAAMSLQMVLQLLGAEVHLAHDGPAALATLAEHDCEVVLLDVGMPGMDGYEVARRIRAGHPDRCPLLIAVTGWGQEEDRRRAREAGIDHHLVKPADLTVLQQLLARVSTQPSPPEGQLTPGLARVMRVH